LEGLIFGKNILDIKVNNWSEFRAFTIARLCSSENLAALGFGDGRQRAFLKAYGIMVVITLVPSKERICLVEGA
jgi:peroxiredoxin